MELVANTPKGSPCSNSGIRTALPAYMASPTRPILVPIRVRFMTEIFVISLPVPQVVGMITSSWRLSRLGMASYRSSRQSPGSATAMALAMSITVPPPIAMMRR